MVKLEKEKKLIHLSDERTIAFDFLSINIGCINSVFSFLFFLFLN